MKDKASKTMVLLLAGTRIGVASEGLDGKLSLTYDDSWRAAPAATPISLSMPTAARSFGDAIVRAFLWGLLPDNDLVLERWARAYQVSARNPFALLLHVGEDCAGAIQVARADRVEALLAGEGGVVPVTEAEVAERIRVLRRDPAAWHLTAAGQFSLAGAQAKTALHFDPVVRRWGDPWGAVPTTHIIKPAVTGLDDHDLNEHLCLETANRLGLRAAHSKVVSFKGERAIVVDRYDRIRKSDGTVSRVHQEDMCQALGLHPTAKYQNEGGPAPEQIISLFRDRIRPVATASREIGRLVDALAFNWIIAGTDAHAKNYSVLLAGGQVRLAPLYDIASALPYHDMYLPKLRMAMRIGGEYRVERVAGRHWRRFAVDNGLDADDVVARIDDLAARTPAALDAAVRAAGVRRLDGALPGRLAEQVTARAASCRQALAAG